MKRRTVLSLVVVALAFTIWAAIGVRRIDGREEFGLLLGVLPGAPRVVEDGWTWAPPGLSRLERVPVAGWTVALPTAAEAMWPASDGTRFGLVGAVRVGGSRDRWRDLADALRAGSCASIVRTEVAAAASRFAKLRDGRGSLPALAREFERELGTRLEKHALVLLSVDIASLDLLRAVPGAAIRPNDRRLLVIGLDGADWRLIDPLLAAGRMPHLDGLIRRGVRARLLTLSPMISPVVWTTIATGVDPARHGIVDFLVPAGSPHAGEPVTSAQRRVPTVWQMLSDRGVPVGIVGWWATWPAERVDGYVVSDRVAYQLFGHKPERGRPEGKTWPPDLFDAVAERVVAPDTVPWRRVAAFLEGRRRAPADFPEGDRERLDGLRTLLAAGDSYVDIALDLRDRHPPAFEAVYLEGTDTVGHLFMRFRPPRLPGVPTDDFESFRSVIDRYYEAVDAYIGRLLEDREDWTIAVLSDHGFASDETRPLTTDSRIGHGAAADWHRRFGILVLAGPDVRQGARIDEASVYDVAPTILALYGLPVPESWRGRVLAGALDPSYFDRFPVRLTEDNAPAATRDSPAADVPDDDDGNAAIREKLTSLGYLVAPRAGGDGVQDALSTANNRAVAAIAQGRHQEAARLLREALERFPDQPMLLTNLGIALRLDGRPAEAEPFLERAFRSPATRSVAGHQLAQIRSDAGDLAGAESYLRLVLAEEPGAADAHNGLGLVLEKRGDREGAERAYLEASRIDGAAAEPRNNLGNLAKSRGDLERAEQWYLQAIEADPYFMGAYNNLALIYQDRGDVGGAIDLYERALAKAPDNAVVLNNLGSLYFATGERAEARRLWEQAGEADPKYPSPWNNLAGIALVEGRGGDAETLLEKALAIDPDYGDARINLAILERSRGRPDRARAELDRAVRDPRARVNALVQRAILGLEAGRAADALADLTEAATAAPRNVEVLNLLGEAALRAGERPRAAVAWRESLRLRPGQAEIESALLDLENR